MRYVFGAFVAWILLRKRLSVYADLVATPHANPTSGADKLRNQ